MLKLKCTTLQNITSKLSTKTFTILEQTKWELYFCKSTMQSSINVDNLKMEKNLVV